MAKQAERVEAVNVAERIAARLFTNLHGDKVERLVLTNDGPPVRDFGGWCEGAVRDVVDDELRKAKRRANQRKGKA